MRTRVELAEGSPCIPYIPEGAPRLFTVYSPFSSTYIEPGHSMMPSMSIWSNVSDIKDITITTWIRVLLSWKYDTHKLLVLVYPSKVIDIQLEVGDYTDATLNIYENSVLKTSVPCPEWIAGFLRATEGVSYYLPLQARATSSFVEANLLGTKARYTVQLGSPLVSVYADMVTGWCRRALIYPYDIIDRQQQQKLMIGGDGRWLW